MGVADVIFFMELTAIDPIWLQLLAEFVDILRLLGYMSATHLQFSAGKVGANLGASQISGAFAVWFLISITALVAQRVTYSDITVVYIICSSLRKDTNQ